MKIESVVPHKYNIIPLFDREWFFMTDDGRPAHCRLKEGKLTLWHGEKGNKSIYDGEFYEVFSFKPADEFPTWESIAERLSHVSVKIID